MKKKYITYETLIQELNGRDINYNDLLLTVEWSNKREEILRRDSYHCSKCGNDSTIEHYDEKSHKKFHLWLGELKPTLVKREDGRSEQIYRPEVTVSNKAYHMHVHHRFYILNRLPCVILPKSWAIGLVKKALKFTKQYDQTNTTKIFA